MSRDESLKREITYSGIFTIESIKPIVCKSFKDG